ncbi:MAG: hypothetical protein ACQERH_09425 [Acidobacteriota bacterium]
MDDSLKKAIEFISDNIKRMPKKDRAKIIERAAKKFELNPKQEEFLIKKFVDSK